MFEETSSELNEPKETTKAQKSRITSQAAEMAELSKNVRILTMESESFRSVRINFSARLEGTF